MVGAGVAAKATGPPAGTACAGTACAGTACADTACDGARLPAWPAVVMPLRAPGVEDPEVPGAEVV